MVAEALKKYPHDEFIQGWGAETMRNTLHDKAVENLIAAMLI